MTDTLGPIRGRHFRCETRDLFLEHHPAPAFEHLIARALEQMAATIGDVVVFACRGDVSADAVRRDIVGTNPMLVRSAAIWDVYESSFGNAVLRSSGRDVAAHHTQIRWTVFDGVPVAQVAAYPSPSMASGFRVWVEPATILIFVDESRFETFCELLQEAQYLWERLRAHHGAPLLLPLPDSLAFRYPVPSRPLPMSSADFERLTDAVIYLNDETAIDTVIGGNESPQRAVEKTLLARRVVQQHHSRLTTVLDHAHGSVTAKYDSLSTAMEFIFTHTQTDPQQLLAPHRHLRDSLEETRQEIASIAATASETANLVASATVGKLLDKSEANRTAGAAVAAALAIISLVTTFTTIAAIPAENRHESSLIRLAAGIALSAIVVVAVLIALTRLSTRSSARLAGRRRKILVLGANSCVLAAVALLIVCIDSARLVFVVTAGALVLIAATLLATANDF